MPLKDEASYLEGYFERKLVTIYDYGLVFDLSLQGIYSRILDGDWEVGKHVVVSNDFSPFIRPNQDSTMIYIDTAKAKSWAKKQRVFRDV